MAAIGDSSALVDYLHGYGSQAIGKLRQDLKRHGLNVTIPDAHIAQCALDLEAPLLTRDKIFRFIAQHVPLRLA